MFINPLNRIWAFYFDVEDREERKRLEEKLMKESFWIKKFEVGKCSRAEQFLTTAMPLKTHLRTVIVSTWLFRTRLRAPRFLDRTRAVAPADTLHDALHYDRRNHQLLRFLNPKGRAMRSRIIAETLPQWLD